MITYRTLPGSSTRYQRVNVGECTAWVETNVEFDVEVRHPDQTTETKPFVIDTFCQHHGAVEPILYLSPSGKWVRRVSFAELPGLKPKPPLFIEITQPLATKWLWANGYPVPGCAAPSRGQRPNSRSARPLARARVCSPALARGTTVAGGSRERNPAALPCAICTIPGQPRHQICRPMVAIHQG